ncbi:hypothetical protein CPA58_22845 [Klebsiella pneumoniae]|nr:hypothetical protein CPA58_22845 [Klebsiella pneumoniae]
MSAKHAQASRFCNRAHTSIEHSRDWCRSLLILNCQELAAQQPLRPINWCSRLLKMTRTINFANQSIFIITVKVL